MANSRKRHQSMSPTRSQQPQDTPEHKKRKPNAPTSNGASSSKSASASRSQVARSPGPAASDSSITLDGDTPPSKDKGKAVEKDPLVLELERLRKEVVHKNELLEDREKTISAVTQTLTCQICLDLMQMPYALAPCGHVSCHTCLVAWFTSPHNDHAGDEHDPDVEWFSDDGSSVDAYDEHLPAHIANGNAQENGNPANGNPANGNPVDAHANGNANGNPPALANGNPPAPAPAPIPAFPNSVHRRKTCPHCRCVVRERPVQVYALKDLVAIIEPPAEPVKHESPKRKDKKEADKGKKEVDKDKKETGKEREKDPWKGIFRPPRAPGPAHGGADPWGGFDEDEDSDEDPGPWPGFGMGLGGGGPNPALLFADVDEEEEAGPHLHHPFLYNNPYHHPNALPPHPHPNPQPPQPPQPPPPPFVDEEDGVRRCGACMHELWRGECTNANCGVVYHDDASEGGSDAGGYAPEYGGARRGADDEDGDEEDGVAWPCQDPESEALDEDADDGYESSFIDDEEQRERRARRLLGSDGEGGGSEGGAFLEEVLAEVEEDDFVPGPSRRWSRGGQRRSGTRQETIVISSDEDDDEEDEAPGPSSRVSRGRTRTRRIVDEEDDEEGEEQEVEGDVGSVEDGNLADEAIAFPVVHPDLDGDDGSSSSLSVGSPQGSLGSPWRTNPDSADHLIASGDEEEDEGAFESGEVPFWADEEDEGQDQDDVVYLHGDEDDGDSDDGEGY